MFSKRSCVGKCIHIDCTNFSFFICPHSYSHFHLMTWRRCNLGFFPCIDNFCRFPRLHCHNCRIHFCDYCLFCSESSSYSRFDHSNLRLRYIQRIRKDTSHMECNLRRGYHVQSSISIHICICAECLHHCLLVCLRMIRSLHYIITVFQNLIHISILFRTGRAKISFIIRAHIA